MRNDAKLAGDAVNQTEVEINYDGRFFQRADSKDAPVALYKQKGKLLTGKFSGGEILQGYLCGEVKAGGVIHFAYSMTDVNFTVISGECVSEPTVDEDGKVSFREVWTRFCPTQESGVSFLKEICDGNA